MNKYDKIVMLLQDNKETISFMESCTGGFLSNTLTNIEGASLVFSFGAITYSNEYKIRLGVDKNIIDTYTVYSVETAKEMARAISSFTHSTYGVGVTGKLGVSDPFNPSGEDNMVYISIYDSKRDFYLVQTMTMEMEERGKLKESIAHLIGFLLYEYLQKNK